MKSLPKAQSYQLLDLLIFILLLPALPGMLILLSTDRGPTGGGGFSAIFASKRTMIGFLLLSLTCIATYMVWPSTTRDGLGSGTASCSAVVRTAQTVCDRFQYGVPWNWVGGGGNPTALHFNWFFFVADYTFGVLTAFIPFGLISLFKTNFMKH